MKESIRKFVAGTRFIIILAVVGAFVASLTALVYGHLVVVVAIKDIIQRSDFSTASVRLVASNLVNIIDLLLLGTVLYIISVGLYKLFIDDEVRLPGWLDVTDLDSIKTKLLTVVVVLLGVEFLASVVEFTGNNIPQFGAAIGIVLIALASFLFVMTHGGSSEAKDKSPEKAPETTEGQDQSSG